MQTKHMIAGATAATILAMAAPAHAGLLGGAGGGFGGSLGGGLGGLRGPDTFGAQGALEGSLNASSTRPTATADKVESKPSKIAQTATMASGNAAATAAGDVNARANRTTSDANVSTIANGAAQLGTESAGSDAIRARETASDARGLAGKGSIGGAGSLTGTGSTAGTDTLPGTGNIAGASSLAGTANKTGTPSTAQPAMSATPPTPNSAAPATKTSSTGRSDQAVTGSHSRSGSGAGSIDAQHSQGGGSVDAAGSASLN
jgi:hypothetical protein